MIDDQVIRPVERDRRGVRRNVRTAGIRRAVARGILHAAIGRTAVAPGIGHVREKLNAVRVEQRELQRVVTSFEHDDDATTRANDGDSGGVAEPQNFAEYHAP